jgi:ketosteroid isomerase-like protein
MTTSKTATVLEFFAAYQAQDEAAARSMVADDFQFTSPRDDHLDVERYFEICFPTVDHFASQTMMETAEVGDTVLVRYEYEVADGGGRFRNVEALTVDDSGLIRGVEVYFGGEV